MKSVAIIGAGPAGSIAAIVLARAGIDVMLVEQHRYPHDKVCGECLSALGLDVLQRLGLKQPLRTYHPAPLVQSILHATDGSSARLPLANEMWGISRITLDPFLLHAARSAGARVIQPARLEKDGQVRDLVTNQLLPLSADFILSANGKPARRPSELGLKAHFRHIDAPKDAIGLFGVRGHYGGIAPIEDGLWNVAFSVPIRRFAGESVDGVFEQIQKENIALARQMRRAERVGDWLTSPLPRFAVQRDWPHGFIPIGNAAAAIEPIGGEGMGLAMRSAEIAAQHLVEAILRDSEPNLDQLRKDYRKLWNLRSLACRAAAVAVSSPWLCRLLLPLVHVDDPLTTAALRAMGKA